MPVAPSDLKHFKSANHPSDDTSLVGGAIAVTEILGTVVGEVAPAGSIVADPSGGVDQLFYYKSFLKNAHATLALLGAKVWVMNGLDPLATPAVIKLLSTSASDGSTKKARIYGKNNANGLIETEDVTLNGTTPVTSTKTFSELYRVAILLVSDSSVTTAVGDIEVRRNDTNLLLGIVPGSSASGAGTGYSWATAEVDIGLATAQNDSGTSTNRKTAPTGPTFSRPNTEAEALAVPGTDLGANSAIGIWWKWTIKPAMTPPPAVGVQEIPILKGTSA